MQSSRQYSLQFLAAASDAWQLQVMLDLMMVWQPANILKLQHKEEKTIVKKAKGGEISVNAHHNV